MTIAFSIVAILILVVIYYVIQNQALANELIKQKNINKQLGKNAKAALSGLSITCIELQKLYLARIADSKRHGLLTEENYNHAFFVISKLGFVIMRAIEMDISIERALQQACSASPYKSSEIKKFISQQPNEVRMAWSQNTVVGYMSAISRLSYIGQYSNATLSDDSLVS